jgi:hypothetical protein
MVVQTKKFVYRARIFKRLWSPGIESKEWIPPAYEAWRVPSLHRLLAQNSKIQNTSIPACKQSRRLAILYRQTLTQFWHSSAVCMSGNRWCQMNFHLDTILVRIRMAIHVQMYMWSERIVLWEHDTIFMCIRSIGFTFSTKENFEM